ncbi:hypothetical protein [Salipaludibacillus daqingensis]|uniref:hypothetical protein n=1 Tax=Salipaludibacillus daqingensis TaxID=3041001 RepID=UPI00247572F1|nr:hypothetical protein [Salipaludibacillus daqingensis]
MTDYEKDAYFERRDQLIKKLSEPEKSIYGYFRQVEKSNMKEYGKLIVDGKSPIAFTADHFMMSTEEIKQVCLSATTKLNELSKKY